MRSLTYLDIKYVFFASASEIEVLILYFRKPILGIQKNRKAS